LWNIEKRNGLNETFDPAGIYLSVDVYSHHSKNLERKPSTKRIGLRRQFNRMREVKQKGFHLMRNEDNGPS